MSTPLQVQTSKLKRNKKYLKTFSRQENQTVISSKVTNISLYNHTNEIKKYPKTYNMGREKIIRKLYTWFKRQSTALATTITKPIEQ